MKQTEHFDLNLLEGSDPVDWEAFNENFSGLDSALEGVRALAKTGADFAAGLQNCRMTCGTYVGSGQYGQTTPNRLTFDFKPLLVVLADEVTANLPSWPGILLGGCPQARSPGANVNTAMAVTWEDNAVRWFHYYSADGQANYAGRTYYYVALGLPN